MPWLGRPAAYGVDRLWAYQNRTCLEDPETKDYCTNINAKWQDKLPDHDIQLVDLPKEHLCSPCFMNTLRQMQSTTYSNYDKELAEQFEAAQKGTRRARCTNSLLLMVFSLWSQVPMSGSRA